MITTTVTEFRNKMFAYLDKIEQGETIILKRKNKEVARLVPVPKPDWRSRMKNRTEICVSAEELIAPIEDIWENHA